MNLNEQRRVMGALQEHVQQDVLIRWAFLVGGSTVMVQLHENAQPQDIPGILQRLTAIEGVKGVVFQVGMGAELPDMAGEEGAQHE